MASLERDESYYEFPHAEDAAPLFTFKCKNCGKEINVYSKYDQRTTYCCGLCAKEYKAQQARQKRAKKKSSNIGMSGGMSLGSLIRREARSVDKEVVMYEKKCAACGKTFWASNDKRRYCSKECRIAEKESKKVKTCPRCGKQFIASNEHKIYCSADCAFFARHVKKIPQEKTCPVCKRRISLPNFNQKYCSVKCRDIARYRRSISRYLQHSQDNSAG